MGSCFFSKYCPLSHLRFLLGVLCCFTRATVIERVCLMVTILRHDVRPGCMYAL